MSNHDFVCMKKFPISIWFVSHALFRSRAILSWILRSWTFSRSPSRVARSSPSFLLGSYTEINLKIKIFNRTIRTCYYQFQLENQIEPTRKLLDTLTNECPKFCSDCFDMPAQVFWYFVGIDFLQIAKLKLRWEVFSETVKSGRKVGHVFF